MRSIYSILIISCFLLTGCEYHSDAIFAVKIASSDDLSWEGLKNEYTHFSQIKVELLNERKNSVFLPHVYPPDSEAHLERFNETTKQWEMGENGREACKSIERFIEIKPNEHKEIVVDWHKAFSPHDRTKFGIGYGGGSTGEERPLSGTYRLTLIYSTTPEWKEIKNLPQTKSPEFQVNWDENSLVKTDKGGC